MEDPVAKLKELQRSDPAGKAQWEAYTEQHGQGVRDPSKHDPDFVWGFLESYLGGYRMEVKDPLILLMKEGQRKSPAWKRCWQAYCASHGQQMFDPAKHDQASLTGFINYLGESGEKMLRMGGPNTWHSDGPPLKKMNLGNSFGGNPGVNDLVQAVKTFQKQSEENKMSWGNFCDTNLGGKRDPAKHDASILQQFLMSHGVQPPSAGGNGWPTATIAPHAQPAAAPGALDLVARIKDFQRQGEAQREHWGRFADEHLMGKRDPAKADPYMLQEFIKANGI